MKHPHRPRPERKRKITYTVSPLLESAAIGRAELPFDANEAFPDAAPARREGRHEAALVFVGLRALDEGGSEDGGSPEEGAPRFLSRVMRFGERLCDCASDTVAPIAFTA